LVQFTVPLAPLRLALHEPVTVVPDASVVATLHPRRAADPAVTLTVATNPPFQEFNATDAVQPPGIGSSVVVVVVVVVVVLVVVVVVVVVLVVPPGTVVPPAFRALSTEL
jgi:hypothetical protein